MLSNFFYSKRKKQVDKLKLTLNVILKLHRNDLLKIILSNSFTGHLGEMLGAFLLISFGKSKRAIWLEAPCEGNYKNSKGKTCEIGFSSEQPILHVINSDGVTVNKATCWERVIGFYPMFREKNLTGRSLVK